MVGGHENAQAALRATKMLRKGAHRRGHDRLLRLAHARHVGLGRARVDGVCAPRARLARAPVAVIDLVPARANGEDARRLGNASAACADIYRAPCRQYTRVWCVVVSLVVSQRESLACVHRTLTGHKRTPPHLSVHQLEHCSVETSWKFEGTQALVAWPMCEQKSQPSHAHFELAPQCCAVKLASHQPSQ